MLSALVIVGLCATTLTSASPHANTHSIETSNGPQVDLGYTVYSGITNSTNGLNIFKGIRFAAPPTGSSRWQAPKAPPVNRTAIVQATSFAPECPQSLFSLEPFTNNPGVIGDEDCLFLNVYAPTNASELPVLVYIHGGGYGAGNGSTDLSELINTNNNSFIGVVIQHRLGAFGFLSSDEVFRRGVSNAGLLDQKAALQWVQDYIHLFGGDPKRVTVSGESAGGGSVMLLAMAYNGTLGNSLFENSIAASPYLPTQYGYKDWIPSQSYYAFATQAGCPASTAYGSSSQTIFDCLLTKDTTTLQLASFNVSASGPYGSWAFVPVTDGSFVADVPSQQLLRKQVNGKRILSGNNGLEGVVFVPPSITSQSALLDWIHLLFPLFTDKDVTKLLAQYNYTSDPHTLANDIYGETTFVCPSYWLAEAYSSNGKQGFKYQYSVPPSTHGSDVTGYFGPASPNQSPDLVKAFITIWGNFITTSNPSIPSNIASPSSSPSTSYETSTFNFPPYTKTVPKMVNLNETGGAVSSVNINGMNFTTLVGPGLKNDITVVDAYAWENGRGKRCGFWREIGGLVPE